MGGRGSGGVRVGAGRKSKGATVLQLHGGRDRKPKAAKAIAAPEPVTMPADLPAEQGTVWGELAPHATQARTLTPQTSAAFRDLCEAIVLKRALLAQVEQDGLTYLKISVDGAGVEHSEVKAHPLLAQHRGMMQRVEAGMAKFQLAPIGKPIVAEAKPEDPFEEFEREGTVQ